MDGAPEGRDNDHYGMIISVCTTTHWLSSRLGLDLARLADLPESVISEARRVAEYLTEQEARDQQQSKTSKIALRRRALLRVMPST